MFDFSALRILVLGDVMLDRFLYGAVERISPEAPVPVVRLGRTLAMPGGAGNVARNISALGGQAVLVGLVGRDPAAAEFRALLAADTGITDATVDSASRPTICKMRVIAGTQQLVRLDDEVSTAADAAEQAALVAAVEAALPGCAALVLSDYAKGVLTPALIAAAIAAARRAGIPVLADPKSDDFALYRGADCLTPNARELGRAARLPVGTEAEVAAAAGHVMAAAGLPALLCTRAEKGMTLVRAGGGVDSVPAEAREVFDVSGAGDTVIAALALAHAAGHPLAEAMRIANAAAGIVVGKLGTAVAYRSEVFGALHASGIAGAERKVATAASAVDRVALWHRQGLKVGFTNGCFDLLHPGHLHLLRQARAACDRLVVGLNTDASVSRLKGPTRPVQSESARAAVLGSLTDVDLVVPFGEETPIKLIRALRPDVLVKGADYTVKTVVGAPFVKSYGGRVVLAQLKAGHSTTATVARLKK